MLVTVDAATGQAFMTCHSTMDHPDLGPGEGTWQFRTAGSEHPFVSILHFSADDPPLGTLAGAAGWWQVSWNGGTFFYHLTAGGLSRWVDKKPTSANPPANPKGTGHWYAGKQPDDLVLVWTTGGVAEVTVDLDLPAFGGSESGFAVTGTRL